MLPYFLECRLFRGFVDQNLVLLRVQKADALVVDLHVDTILIAAADLA